MLFQNTKGEKFNLNEVFSRIKNFIKDYESTFKLIIGTDSLYRKTGTKYITAIVLYKVGNGGVIFYTKKFETKRIGISARIMQETSNSVEILQKLKESELLDLIGLENIEVHIDCGENGKSRTILSCAKNYIESLGFFAAVKPNAWGASTIADKWTK